MNRVYVVADSSTSVPDKLAAELEVTVVPVLVRVGDNKYEDGVDLSEDAFYEALRAGCEAHTTGPSVGHFLRAFESIPSDAAGLLVITLPSAVSSTYSAAVTAVETFAERNEELPIRVMELPTALGAAGLVVMEVARLAQNGFGLKQLAEKTNELAQAAGIYIALDTVSQLIQGGRLGRFAGWVATKLNIKPVLEIAAGELRLVARVRSMRRALDMLVELVVEQLEQWDEQAVPRFIIQHADAPERAEALYEQLREAVEPFRALVGSVSPVLGAHSGPGAVGIAFLKAPSEGGE
jgi:DegV family protein with EDD domain